MNPDTGAGDLPLVELVRRTRIGLVASGDATAQVMRLLLREAGYRIEPVLTPAQLAAGWRAEQGEGAPAAPDLWLLDATGVNADADELLASIAEHAEAPFLINDEVAPLAQPEALAEWRRRLLDKVDEMAAAVGAPALALASPPAPAMVWVLAASTGGPEAVHQFLAALPPGLPLALLYAQHIDAGFDATLVQSLERHRHYPARLCRGEQHLQPQRLLLVPADRQLRFLPFHRVLETRRAWPGRYRPAIDGVVAELARMYQNRCGVIVFSGLCDDGALGCRVARASGATVWVQTPASCISPEMPRAALATGVVTYQGTPAELAAAVAARFTTPRAAQANSETTATT